MKNIFKPVLVLGLAATFTLTGCIEEEFPTSSVSQEQLDNTAAAGKALVYEMPAYMIKFTDNGWHGSFGYGSMMHIRDLLTGDLLISQKGSSYNQWSSFENTSAMQENRLLTQYMWNYYTGLVLTANKVAAFYPESNEDPEAQGCRSLGLAYRAMAYLDMARMYEFLPVTVYTEKYGEGLNAKKKNILNLTVPIVTENTSLESAYDNPRASRDSIAAFILSDLDYAEQHINQAPFHGPTLPNIAAVYGLKARTYMWLGGGNGPESAKPEYYLKAIEYADKAIAAQGGQPLTESEWTDPVNGFNTPDSNTSWMWCCKPEAENDVVMTGIINWPSHMTFEAIYGYGSVDAAPVVDASFYKKVSNNDFRKLSWVPGQGVLLSVKYADSEVAAAYDYKNQNRLFSIKFRPYQGNIYENSVGSCSAIPVMRLEEMYFIKFEAMAQTGDVTGAKDAYIKFMNDHRMRTKKDGTKYTYTCKATTKEDVIDEIVLSKRIELWGEGQSFFDIKRLNMGVTRFYTDTNWSDASQFNTIGRPAWTDVPIVLTEGNSNKAVKDFNNPAAAGVYTAKQPAK